MIHREHLIGLVIVVQQQVGKQVHHTIIQHLHPKVIDSQNELRTIKCYSLTGHYMYIETSSPHAQGDIARLISPRFPSSIEYNCLEFYYHQYGIDVDTLNVYKRDVGGSLNPLKLFTAQGNRFDEWHIVQINFVPNKPYNIMFEGIVGKGFEGVRIQFPRTFDKNKPMKLFIYL